MSLGAGPPADTARSHPLRSATTRCDRFGVPYICSVRVRLMTVPEAELTALHRSTAMLQPKMKATVAREQLLEIIDELLDTRRLLARLGGDLKTVARRSGT